MQRADDAMYALVAFYDLLDYPLTYVELWRLLRVWGKEMRLRDVVVETDRHPLLKTKEGFVHLPNREWLVAQRRHRYTETEQQLRRGWQWLQLIASMPGVRAIFLCNTYGLSNPSETSDIDLFIVTDPSRIWTARLWTTALLRILRLRPKERHEAGSICLSFYASEQAIDFTGLKEEKEDVYLDAWKQWLIPLYDPKGVRNRMGELNRAIIHPICRQRWLRPRAWIKRALGWMPLETAARIFQWRILPMTLRMQANASTHVIITNELLKFHTNDGRRSYKKIWKRRLEQAARARQESVA